MNNEIEIWKDIPNYEGYYQCSNFGRVKSVKREIINSLGKKCKYKERILIQLSNGNGYKCNRLYKGGIYKHWKVHQLITITFLSHIVNGYKLVIDHIDNDRSNNRLSNLQIISQRENCIKGVNKIKKTSKYTGVCLDKSRNLYKSRITINGKKITIGRFKDEYEAHLAYKNKLKEIENE